MRQRMTLRHLSALLLLVTSVSASQTWLVPGEDQVIQLMGLHPLTGDWPDGPALRYVMDVAVEHVNNHPDILAGYKLNVTWIDSGVSVLLD